jgi:hypothetical protein
MRLARHITRFAIPFRAATRLPCVIRVIRVIRVIPAAATPRVRRPVVRAASGLVALERELDELHRVEEALGCRWAARLPLALGAAPGGTGRQSGGQALPRRLM